MAKTRASEWEKILMAADCDECPDCGEPWCEKHKAHYADCACLGPTMDGVEYKVKKGILYGRRTKDFAA